MPDETWCVRTTTVDSGAFDSDAGLAFDTPLAIVNNDPNTVLEVRDIGCDLSHGVDVTMNASGLGYWTVRAITALVGGRDLTPAPHRSDNTALPSQVKIVQRPDQVTISSNIHRRFVPAGGLKFGLFGSVSALNFQRVKGDMGAGGGMSSGGTVFAPADSGTCQSIILREGEGIALYNDGPGTVFDMRQNICVSVVATGATFSVPGNFGSAGPGIASSAIFNGSGSGVVLKITRWSATEEAECILQLGKYRVLCGPMKIINGEDIKDWAYPFSSDAAALPSGVQIYRNTVVYPRDIPMSPNFLQQLYEGGGGAGAIIAYYGAQRVFERVLAWQAAQRLWNVNRLVWDQVKSPGKTGFRLRYGEGIAIVHGARYAGMFGGISGSDVFENSFQNHDFYAVFTRTSGASAFAGSGMSRSRVVNA